MIVKTTNEEPFSTVYSKNLNTDVSMTNRQTDAFPSKGIGFTDDKDHSTEKKCTRREKLLK